MKSDPWLEELQQRRRVALERWRNVGERLDPAARAYIPVASHRKSVREQLTEAWAIYGLWAGRAARRPLWAQQQASEHQHSLPSRERARNPDGTGIVNAYRELVREEKAVKAEVTLVEKMIANHHKRPPKPQGGFQW